MNQKYLKTKSSLEFSHCYFLTQFLTKHNLNITLFCGSQSLIFFFSISELGEPSSIISAKWLSLSLPSTCYLLYLHYTSTNIHNLDDLFTNVELIIEWISHSNKTVLYNLYTSWTQNNQEQDKFTILICYLKKCQTKL